jgi:glucose-1-phosphate adenylyltransferase
LKRVFVLTQYLSESICKYARAITWFDDLLCLPPQVGQSYLGTADAVRRNAARLLLEDCDHVLILAADHIYKMDYRKLLDFHRNSGADATIAAVENPRCLSSDFGVMEVDGSGRVISFTEKPAYPTSLPSDPSVSLVSMGVYVFKKKALWEALEGGANDFGKEVVPQLVSSGRLYSYNFTASQPGAYWRDVGTLDSYYQTQMELLQNSSLMTPDLLPAYSPRWAPETLTETPGIAASVISEKAFVSPLAMVRKSIVLDGARVGSGARIQNAIVLEGASVPPNTTIGFNRQADGNRFQITTKGVIIVNTEAARLTEQNQGRLA